jgi:predicted Zn-dependent protease
MRRVAATLLCTLLCLAARILPAAATAPLELLARAEATLRAAELRPDGPATLEFYRRSQSLAAEALEALPDSARANFVYFATSGRLLMADGVVKNVFALRRIDQYLEKALELDPRHPGALATKGGLLLDLPGYLGGDPQEAERFLGRALAENPSGVGTRILLARAKARNGDVKGAAELARLAAHQACTLRRAKNLGDAVALLDELHSQLARAEKR